MNKNDKKHKVKKKKIMKTVMGLINVNENEIRQIINYEIEDISEIKNITRFMKSSQIRWYRHILVYTREISRKNSY